MRGFLIRRNIAELRVKQFADGRVLEVEWAGVVRHFWVHSPSAQPRDSFMKTKAIALTALFLLQSTLAGHAQSVLQQIQQAAPRPPLDPGQILRGGGGGQPPGELARNEIRQRRANSSISSRNLGCGDGTYDLHLVRPKIGMMDKRSRPRPRRPNRPNCTLQLPSGHTCALDFFPAEEAYNLIASDWSWFGTEACAATMKRFGSRH